MIFADSRNHPYFFLFLGERAWQNSNNVHNIHEVIDKLVREILYFQPLHGGASQWMFSVFFFNISRHEKHKLSFVFNIFCNDSFVEAQLLSNYLDVTESLTHSLTKRLALSHISVVCGSIWMTLRFYHLEFKKEAISDSFMAYSRVVSFFY